MAVKRKRLIYLDHNSTTPLLPEAEKAIRSTFREYGNPSSLCLSGREAKALIEEARQEVARFLGVGTKGIVFTGSGTEANNLAIKGYFEYLRIIERRKPEDIHILCSSIEHSSVIEVFRALKSAGFNVTYLPVDGNGFVRTKDFEKALRPNTVLASIMLANNEIGTIQPVARLARIAHAHRVVFHTDVVQAIGKFEFSPGSLRADMLSLSGHKIGALKGIGALCVQGGLRLMPLMDGGGQERGFRSGTENVAGIVSLGAAFRSLNEKDLCRASEKVLKLRQRLEQGLRKRIPHIRINTPEKQSLPNTSNVSFEGIEAETIVMNLDLAGVCVSGGSTCHSEEFEPSPVLLAMGLDKSLARSAVRFSLCDTNNVAEIDYVLRVLPSIVKKLRQL